MTVSINRYIKRILDCIISGGALVLIWPLYPIVGALIVAEDGFPVFYRAERGSYQGKTFRICKFRTMVKNADKIGGGTTALNDPRITKIGNILRKTKLDEIPQLGQMFLGSMSIIGPRSELLQYTELCTYRMLISLCQLILEGMLLTTDSGEYRLASFVDEQRMSRLYEKFLLEYYAKECPG